MKRLWMTVLVLWMTCFSSGSLAADGSNGHIVADTALVVQLAPEGVGKPKEIEDLIYREISERIKNANHTTVSTETLRKDFRAYVREHGNGLTRQDAVQGMFLRREDFKALADIEHVRYVMLISPRITSVENKDNIWTGSRNHVTVLTEIVLYDAETDEYIWDEELISTGKTGGSRERAYHRAIRDMLQQFTFTY